MSQVEADGQTYEEQDEPEEEDASCRIHSPGEDTAEIGALVGNGAQAVDD